MCVSLSCCFVPFILFFGINILWKLYNRTLRDTEVNCPLPPGSFGLPLIGETYLFILFKIRFFDQMRRKYGSIYKTHLFGRPTIRISNAGDINSILKENSHNITTFWPRSTHALLKGGIALETSSMIHKAKRKLVLRAFNHESLSRYVPMITEICESYVKRWMATSYPVNMYPELRTLAFHVVCVSFLGISPPSEDLRALMKLFQEYVNGMFAVPINIPGFSLHKALKARQSLLDKIDTFLQVQDDSRYLKGSCTTSYTLGNLLADNGTPIDEIRTACLELLFAGHETTASAATTMVMNVTKHPEVYDGIRSELKSNNVHYSKLTYGTIIDLVYVGSVIKETLRLNPPIGAGYRRVVNTFTCQGYQVPKDWTLIYGIRESHANCPTVSSPTTFMPERWTSGVTQLADEFLAFGTGRRKCVGRHFAELFLKIFLTVLVQHCKVSLVNENVELDNFPVPHPVDNLPVTFDKV